MADTNEFLKMYDDDRTQQINNMYDAQKASTMAGLESAYNQNMSNAQAAKEQINPTYQQSANDVSAAYERTRRNNNQMAIANGLNTGAQGQQAVAQSNAYMNSLGQVRTAQANALNAADRGMADMEAQYKMQVAQALANNDYQRAAALFDESQNQYARSQDRAKILAGYGDFSGYAGLYGQDAANQMSTIWNTQNPDLAYQLGRISGEQYYNITGKYPIGYTPAGSGYGGGGVFGTHDYELYLGGKPVTVAEYMAATGNSVGTGSAGNGSMSAEDAMMTARADAYKAGNAAGYSGDQLTAYANAYMGKDDYYQAARAQYEAEKAASPKVAGKAAAEAAKTPVEPKDIGKNYTYGVQEKSLLDKIADAYNAAKNVPLPNVNNTKKGTSGATR